MIGKIQEERKRATQPTWEGFFFFGTRGSTYSDPAM
jgi:hypothetical protein